MSLGGGIALLLLVVSCGDPTTSNTPYCPALGTTDVALLAECLDADRVGVSALLGPTEENGANVITTQIVWDEQGSFEVVGSTRDPGVEVFVSVQRVGGGIDWMGVGAVTSDENGLWTLQVSHENLPRRSFERVFRPTENGGFFLVLGVFARSGVLGSPAGELTVVSP